MTGQRVVLASGSRWRRGLLADAGIPCDAVAPDVDEGLILGESPVVTARLRARAKASAVAAGHPGALVVGADQVVHLDGERFDKPVDAADQLRMLRALRGRTHDLTTAVCCVGPGAASTAFEVTSRVRFRADVTDTELDAYVATGEAAGCAGGYMVERRGAWLVAAVDGDWTNVVGLPVFALIDHLRGRGWRLDPEAEEDHDAG
jgi:septum formation protein